MINLFKIKGQKNDDASTANGKPAAKKHCPGELHLHKVFQAKRIFGINLENDREDHAKTTLLVESVSGTDELNNSNGQHGSQVIKCSFFISPDPLQ